MNHRDLKLGTPVNEALAYLQMCRMFEDSFSLGEKASDFRARPILGEILYILSKKKKRKEKRWQIRLQRIHFPIDTFSQTHSPQKLAEAFISAVKFRASLYITLYKFFCMGSLWGILFL